MQLENLAYRNSTLYHLVLIVVFLNQHKKIRKMSGHMTGFKIFNHIANF